MGTKIRKQRKRPRQFHGIADGKGGLIIPAEAMKGLKNGTITIDGVNYPFITYEGQKYPIITTPQGMTIGGEVANAQHAQNVANAKRTPRFEKFKAKHAESK